MSKSIIAVQSWPFVGSGQLKQQIDLGKDSQAELRKRLPEQIYWVRSPGGRKILWNLMLLKDWLINGDSEAHQRAVEAFLSSLPSNQGMPQKGKTPTTCAGKV
jgi:hypothetical protein